MTISWGMDSVEREGLAKRLKKPKKNKRVVVVGEWCGMLHVCERHRVEKKILLEFVYHHIFEKPGS